MHRSKVLHTALRHPAMTHSISASIPDSLGGGGVGVDVYVASDLSDSKLRLYMLPDLHTA